MQRIDLGLNINQAWDNLISSNNEIIKIFEKEQGLQNVPWQLTRIRQKSGVEFNLGTFVTRMDAVLYKLIYAGVSLKNLEDIYKDRLSTLKSPSDILIDTRPVTEDLLFHADVFFSFVYSAMDISAWLIHFALGSRFLYCWRFLCWRH